MRMFYIPLMLLALIFPTLSMATEGVVGPIYIESVSAISLASSGHKAGNLEIKIQGGFAQPSGMVCSNLYITTLKSVDADRRLFSLVSLAKISKLPVYLMITDDPQYLAYPGRCSLVWVELAQ